MHQIGKQQQALIFGSKAQRGNLEVFHLTTVLLTNTCSRRSYA